ncbi:uncharacterized protein LOC113751078 isoform X2 [Coffea eugenioides]|uniref:uncharacterized protein LOC113751078 isoform X2 n=1 Tax=Coffea eugenioides TaxID=49369 RepID=UPI000F611A81|nr:uncharacterized protein LOC113751078 isoform X2 [Coffea eugenioides]
MEALLMRFDNQMSLQSNSVAINPRFTQCQQQQQQIAAANHGSENTMAPSPFPCRICGSKYATGKYLGDSQWVITCRTCAESAIIKQGGRLADLMQQRRT